MLNKVDECGSLGSVPLLDPVKETVKKIPMGFPVFRAFYSHSD